jgi:lipopolysaccharide export system permease protein
MKAISSRYIQKRLLINFLMVYCVFISIIWFTQSLRFLELVTAKGLSFGTFVQITTFLILPMSYVCIPMAMFFAALLTFSNLESHNEIVVLKACGVSNMQIYRYCTNVLIFVTLLHLSISLYFLPKSYHELKEMQHELKNQLISAILEEGVFNTQTNNITVYIDEKDGETSYKGIFIYDLRDKSKPVTMMAQSGQLIKDGDLPGFLLHNGTHQIEDKESGNISLGFFRDYSFILKNEGAKEDRAIDINEMFIDELLDAGNKSDSDAKIHKVHAMQRITWPLCNFVLPLIAIAGLISALGSRRSTLMKQVRAGAVGIVFITALLMLNNLAMQHFFVIYISAGFILLGMMLSYIYARRQ